MRYFAFLLFILSGLNSYCQKIHEYPKAPKKAVTNIYFEETIEDPYQWMEDPNNPQLASWLDEQAKITKHESNKQTQFWNFRTQVARMFSDRRVKNDDYIELDSKSKDKFDIKTDWNPYTGSTDFLYKLSEKENWKKLIKGNEILEDKEDHVYYSNYSINEKENLIVISVSINGSDWAKGFVYDLTTGSQFPFVLENIRTGTNFEWNGRDLYYANYDKPTKGRELLDKAKGQILNRLSINKENEKPEQVYKNPDTTGTNSFRYDIQEEQLQLHHFLKSRGKWYRAISISDLTKKDFSPRRLLVYPSEDKSELSVVHTKNDSIFLRTNIGAPNGKVLLANLNKPNELSEFIPEYDINLQYVNKLGKDKLACVYLKDGQNIALIYNMQGELLRKIDFPKGKKLKHFYESSDDAEMTDFSISSFFHPDTKYQLNLQTLEFKPTEALYVPYDIENLETRYVTYTSKDGTEIGMYITCEKNTILDGSNPVLMYGYGGYGNTSEPSFQRTTGLLLAHGGILAVPSIRGGGAKGSEWAAAGRRLNKQRTIEDFIAAGEYLIREKYTNPDKLIIKGGSHGALLVESAATKRPELFKAVIAEAGPYDMLRFNLFTVGSVSLNIREFGTPENFEDYKNLRAYSPFHNIEKDQKYPNTLLITGDTDDRVPPHHTYKFLARLQELGDPSSLYHLYLTPGSGHGGALAPDDAIDKILYEYYFMFDQMDIQI